MTPPASLDVSSSAGPFDDCQPLQMADGGKLYDLQRYIDFFTQPGGAKPDPSDVILAAIAAPPAPFSWTLTTPCADQQNTAACPILNHSCVAPSDPSFSGDPAVRLAAVVDAGVTSQFSSLCDTDYSAALDGVAQKIIARLK